MADQSRRRNSKPTKQGSMRKWAPIPDSTTPASTSSPSSIVGRTPSQANEPPKVSPPVESISPPSQTAPDAVKDSRPLPPAEEARPKEDERRTAPAPVNTEAAQPRQTDLPQNNEKKTDAVMKSAPTQDTKDVQNHQPKHEHKSVMPVQKEEKEKELPRRTNEAGCCIIA